MAKLSKYGYFSNDGKEFIITTPLLPRPWINYLTNERYCAIISQCAGGYSFYRDCRTDRILRWLPENWHFDRPGRYIYIRDITNLKNPKVYSATYQPLRRKPDYFQARHGLGYTIIESIYNGIHTKIIYFVPSEDDCEIWWVSLTNKNKKSHKLEIYPYVEWLMGDYHMELRYRNIMNLYNRVWFDKETKAIFAKKTAFWQDLNIQPFKYLCFFSSSLAPKKHATRKYEFLGKYNTEENPESILEGKMKNIRFCSGEDGIAVFQHLIELKPNETKEFSICLGQLEPEKVKGIIYKYRKLEKVKEEFEKTKQTWQKRILDNIWVKTPDNDFDVLVNIWLKYQLYICNFWSRSPSYYHEGSGGRGYRDSCQDSESIVSINPELTRKRILKIASLIRQDGTSAPGWSDTLGPHQFRPNKDHQIWLTSTVYAYVKETGDKEILNEVIPYLKDKWIGGWHIDHSFHGHPTTDGEGTLFEHLEKNLNFTFNDVGKRGLPLIGHADWNDAIDAAGIKLKGESVWLAEGLVRSLKQLAELAKLMGKEDKEKEFLEKAKIMSERIERCAWDGEWYVRGFTDYDEVYGSKTNKEGKIFINTQAWAILAGIPDAEKTKKIITSVKKYLDGPHGLALFYPAYSEFNPHLGRISMFSEGTKENAAVFCHASTFMITALLQIGEGDFAYESMKKIMPNKQKDYDLYKTEPYVYAEYLVGPRHPYLYGEGAFTWITGTSGWTFMAATEWLLGARRDFKGLIIDPCLPSSWKKAFIKRPFRGAIYEIEIENPKGVNKGIKEIYLDGEKLETNLILPHKDGKIHKVKVIMG